MGGVGIELFIYLFFILLKFTCVELACLAGNFLRSVPAPWAVASETAGWVCAAGVVWTNLGLNGFIHFRFMVPVMYSERNSSEKNQSGESKNSFINQLILLFIGLDQDIDFSLIF